MEGERRGDNAKPKFDPPPKKKIWLSENLLIAQKNLVHHICLKMQNMGTKRQFGGNLGTTRNLDGNLGTTRNLDHL